MSASHFLCRYGTIISKIENPISSEEVKQTAVTQAGSPGDISQQTSHSSSSTAAPSSSSSTPLVVTKAQDRYKLAEFYYENIECIKEHDDSSLPRFAEPYPEKLKIRDQCMMIDQTKLHKRISFDR